MKKEMKNGLSQKTICLDVVNTRGANDISDIGNGRLQLNKNGSFEVFNDSAKYSQIKGTWDLCCKNSDYGNYVFTLANSEQYKTNQPEFYVTINSKKVFLIFKSCN